jgi:hypothetical protein
MMTMATRIVPIRPFALKKGDFGLFVKKRENCYG